MKNSVEASVSSNGTASQGAKGQEIEDGTNANGTASGDSDDEKLVIDLDASGSSFGTSGSLKNFPEKVKGIKEEKLGDSSSVESDNANGLKMKIKRTKQTANNKTETKHEIVKDSKVSKLHRNAAIQSGKNINGKNLSQIRKSTRKTNNSSSNASVAAKNNYDEAAEKTNASSCSNSSVPNQRCSVKSSQKVAAEAIKGPKMPSTGSTEKEEDTPTEGVGPGPCEANTKVRLEGIVWEESVAAGLLVVNVTWRGRTYVGTLLDATRHSWAPPRFSDSPTSELEPRTPRGRGRRGRLGTGTLSLECLEQRKLRNKNKRSVTTPSSAGSGGRTPGPESPKLVDGGGTGGSRRRARPPDLDLDEVLRAKRARGASSAASTPINTPMEDIQARASPAPSADTPPPRTIECTEENCCDKFDNRVALALHRKEIHESLSVPAASPTPAKAKKGSRKSRNKKAESMEVEEGETEKPMEVKEEKIGESEKACRLSPESSVSASTIEKTAASSAIPNFTSTCTVSKSICYSYPATSSSTAMANTNTTATTNANDTVQSSGESATTITTTTSDASHQANRASPKISSQTSTAPSLNLHQSTVTTTATSTKPSPTATAPSKKVTAVTATIKPATSCEQQQASSTPTKEKEKKPSRKRKPKEAAATTAAPTEAPTASNPAGARVPAIEPSATVAPSPRTSGEQLVPTQHSPQMLMARSGPREVHAFLQGGTISIGPDSGLQSMGEENLGSPAAYSDISDAEDDHQSERATVAAPRKDKAPVSTPAPPTGGRDIPPPHASAEQHALSAMYSNMNMYSINQYYNNLQHLAVGSAGRGVAVSEASASKPDLKPSPPQQQQENRPSVSANVPRRSDQDVRELAHNYANGKGGDPAEHRRLLETNSAYGHYYKFYMDEKQQVEREKMRQQTTDAKSISAPPHSSMSPATGKDRKGKMLPSVTPLRGKPTAGVRPLQQASVAPQVRESSAGKPVASAAPMPHLRPDTPGKKRDEESPVKIDPAGVSHYLDPAAAAAVAYPAFPGTAALDPLRMAAQLSQFKYASAFMQGFPGPAPGLGDRPPSGAGTDRRDKPGSNPSPVKPRSSPSPSLKPAASPSTKPGLASGAAPLGVTDAKAEEGRDGSPRPQRHLHTHHHTHVVQPGYPLIPGTMPAGTYAALAAAAAAQTYMPPPQNK